MLLINNISLINKQLFNNNNLLLLIKQQKIFKLFLILILFELIQIINARQRRDIPLSIDKEMLPPQYFDEEAPICLAEREPCGFYSFSLDGKPPLKWIKSWCRCSYKHECVYERTDMRMRVYRQTCVTKNDEIFDDKIEETYQRIEDEIKENKHNKHHHHHHHHRKNRRNLNKSNLD
ncbi:hypothetical protein Mgra_00002377 [Meloidogyne graminicola]|uniref:Uncharacterized protein n=1 Tax=Meloidogyne graminicola TaxID=189291 RepID=A0A8S9ZWW6_9BILA|nr:hypothetical protein Mgra_00002377 [Meloidogyne graminicola]